MKFLLRRFTLSAILISSSSIALIAQIPAGRYDAALDLQGTRIPFRLDISGEGKDLRGTLFNGTDIETTTDASYADGKLTLNFEHYLTKIVARTKDGALEGKVIGRFEREEYLSELPFEAKPYKENASAQGQTPSIDGVWEIPYESSKGEKSWRLIVKQEGDFATASVLRIDGDTGALTGTYHDGKFVLSHFDGQRPLLLEATPAADGSLAIYLKGAYQPSEKLVAYRSAVARSKGIPEPDSFTQHTTVRDPNEVFRFRFPDVNGKLVSNADPQFKNKVVLAIVTGTWCPNCHDEAQYLVELYKKYHSKGLEIVALDFEEPEQQENLSREKAFIKQYHVPYTYLIAGAPAEMWEKVPQAVNLNTWPATLFIGRDGKVKLIHSGFAAHASGEFNQQLQAEFTSTIEKLLSEQPGSPSQKIASVPHTSGE